MTPERPTRVRDSVAAVALVFSLYVFFLLFAQFGFLAGIRAAARGTADIHRVLAAMAVAGITASLIAPRTIASIDATRTMALGFFLGAIGGGAAAAAFGERTVSTGELVVVALLTGAGLGFSTVALAAEIRRLSHARNTGLLVGAGTGLAYFFCNVPDVFVRTAATKSWIASAICAAGALVAIAVRRRPSTRDEPPRSKLRGIRKGAPAPMPVGGTLPRGEPRGIGAVLNESNAPARGDLPAALTTPRGIALVACAFLALVWFDSTAFAVVQNTPLLREAMWSGTGLWANAIAHALAAVAGGFVLDRGWFRAALVVAFALLVGATFLFYVEEGITAKAGPLYVAGVSIYSTALAAFAVLALALLATFQRKTVTE